jgi:hypothetical protein
MSIRLMDVPRAWPSQAPGTFVPNLLLGQRAGIKPAPTRHHSSQSEPAALLSDAGGVDAVVGGQLQMTN